MCFTLFALRQIPFLCMDERETIHRHGFSAYPRRWHDPHNENMALARMVIQRTVRLSRNYQKLMEQIESDYLQSTNKIVHALAEKIPSESDTSPSEHVSHDSLYSSLRSIYETHIEIISKISITNLRPQFTSSSQLSRRYCFGAIATVYFHTRKFDWRFLLLMQHNIYSVRTLCIFIHWSINDDCKPKWDHPNELKTNIFKGLGIWCICSHNNHSRRSYSIYDKI